MAQRTVYIEPIGEVILSKRRGAANIRLSINGAGKVRVSMPYWAPYASGIAFVKSRSSWVQANLKKSESGALENGSAIGKAHRLYFMHDASSAKVTSRVTNTEIFIKFPDSARPSDIQKKATSAAEEALRKEAQKLLPQRLQTLAKKHGYSYKNLKIRKLSSRWGSCSSDKVISLSIYLMQLPWELIDYVIIHELLHTEHMHHGPKFWTAFEQILPGAKKLRKQVNQHKPRIEAV